MGGRAVGGEQSTEKGVNRGKVEHMGIKVIEWSVDWKTLFTNCAWLILQAAAYQASRLVSAGHLKGIVMI